MHKHTLLLAVALLTATASAGATDGVSVTRDGITFVDDIGKGLKVTKATGPVVNIPPSVTINDSIYPVTAIANRAFYSNKAIYEVSVPSSVKTIGQSSFDRSSVTTVTLSEGLETIGSEAFYDCDFLITINIPSTVKSIGGRCFESSGITVITIPEGIVDLKSMMLYGCKSLEKVTLPSGLRTIESYAFCGCSALREINLPATVVSIGSYAFSGCVALKTVTLPPLMTTIEDYTFQGCNRLESINLSSNLITVKSSAFYNCEQLKSIAFPEKTRSIGQNAFYGCSNLSEIFIPESLTSIYYYKNNIDHISYDSAFKSCPKIAKLHVRSLNPKSFGAYQFAPSADAQPVTRTLYVPAGTKEKYSKIDSYSRFTIEEESIDVSVESRRRMIVGTNASLEVRTTPSIYPLGSLAWKSDHPSVATVDNYGRVTAVAAGNAVITVSTTVEGKKIESSCHVEVMPEPTAKLSVGPTTLNAGTEVMIPIELTNEDEIVAFQCDIHLPEGMHFGKDEYGEYNFCYAGRESRSHVIESRLQPDGSMRVVGYSPSNATFKGNDGTLFLLPVTLPSVMGDYTLRITDILVTDKSINESPLIDMEASLHVGASVSGDANSDGRLTISDAAITAAYMLGETLEGFNLTNADVVTDGDITLADISEIVNLVLGAPAPASVRKRAHGVEFPTREGDNLHIDSFELYPGEEMEVTVKFDNIEPFTSFYSEIILPEGIKFVDEDGEYFIDLDPSRKHRSHTSACKLQPDGRLRVMAYSSTNALFKGNSGALFTFYIKADDTFDNTVPSAIRLENNYVCNRNEEDKFTDYDINDCEASINFSTGVSSLENEGWNVYVTEGNVLNVEAPEACAEYLVAVDGTSRRIELKEGLNIFAGIAPGLYFLHGVKFVIR